MKLTVVNIEGQSVREHELGFEPILNRKGTQAVHEVVTAYLANQRRGTACTKTRGEVSGGGRKPWRQKGTGRARHGSIRSPIWVGGGVVFGPKPRDYSKKVPKAVKRLALRKALSERIKDGDVLLLDDLQVEAPKTKLFVSILNRLQLNDVSVLIVHHDPDLNLLLASRNVPEVDVTTGRELNTYQVLRYDKLVFTEGALQQVEERLKED